LAVKKIVPVAGTKRAMIAHALSTDIQEGKYPIGSALPSENELAQSFGVSRHTIRIALTTLHDSGLITSHQGVGNIVRANNTSLRYAQSFDSLGNLLQYAANTPVEITGKSEVVANAAMAAWLGCKQGERWWRVTTIRFSSGKKTRVASSEIFIPYMFGSILNHTATSSGTILTLFESILGKPIVEITQEITASKATAAEAKDLKIIPRDPVLRIVRRYFGANRQLFEVSRSAHPAESFSYSMRVRLTMKAAAT
jgi:GntR family transcriptional regulator